MIGSDGPKHLQTALPSVLNSVEVKFVRQIPYPPANRASQGNYFLPKKTDRQANSLTPYTSVFLFQLNLLPPYSLASRGIKCNQFFKMMSHLLQIYLQAKTPLHKTLVSCYENNPPYSNKACFNFSELYNHDKLI